MSMSHDDCQDILVEEKQEALRQRLLGPIGQRLNDQPRRPLRELAVEAIAKASERLVETGHYNGTIHQWVVDADALDELAELVGDLGDIEKEGW